MNAISSNPGAAPKSHGIRTFLDWRIFPAAAFGERHSLARDTQAPDLIYEAPKPISDAEVIAALKKGEVDALRLIPIQLGFHHENWKFIQDVCVRLSEHSDAWVRHNSLLGLSYAARFRGRVEKNIVKPVLLRALKDIDSEVAVTAQDVIDDINLLMGWRIGGAKKQKKNETRDEKRKKG